MFVRGRPCESASAVAKYAGSLRIARFRRVARGQHLRGRRAPRGATALAGEAGNRLADSGRVERILDWARARGLRDGENPARWRGHLDQLLPSRAKVRPVRHFAALPWRDIPAFMESLHRRQGIAAGALEFAILTAARSGEVRGGVRLTAILG